MTTLSRTEQYALRYNLSKKEVDILLPLVTKHNIHIYDAKILYDKYKNIDDVILNINERTFRHRAELWLTDEFKIYNTDRFRTSVLNYLDKGRYTNEIKNKYPQSNYMRFWKEEARRCLYGYLNGDEWITGYFYFYLNYSQIELTKIIGSSQNLKDGKTVQGERVVDFPVFWDSDYFYYHYLEEAERNGLSASVLKTRGRGFSWKAASMLNRNFYLIPRSRSIVYASDDEYLAGGDGILTKAWNQMSFIDEHTPWVKKKQKKDTEHHKRASMIKIVNGTEIEMGFKSEIIGKTLNRSASKARGKRAKLILYEEAGSFNNLLDSWIVSGPSVTQDGVVFGLRVGFGTGGDDIKSFKGLYDLFYKPDTYDIYSIPNIWTSGAYSIKTGWFQPDYASKQGFYDEDGNSEMILAKEMILQEREKIIKSGADISTILKMKAERPIVPEEALLRTTGSPFPVNAIKDQMIFLNQHPDLLGEISKGKLVFVGDNDIKWLESNSIEIIQTHNPSKLNREGGIEIYQHPIQAIKETTFGYIIGVDPIDFDYAEVADSNFSLGSCFVMNTITKRIVAEYTGRPELADTFYETVRRLALYYNATVMYENNIKGLYTYFVNRFSEHLLAFKPKILDDGDTMVSVGRRKYGYTANERINKLGLQFIKKWLSETIDDEGNMTIVNTIKSKGLLDEFIEWNPDGNFDRVSAMIALMVCYKDIERMLESGVNDTNKEDYAKFWNKAFKYR